MATLNFDAESVEPSEALDLIPSGKYHAIIVDSEMKQTSAGDGQYLKLEFQLIDEGSLQNRKVWSNLNLDNPNPKAVEIAEKDLSAIARAVGKLRVTDSAELHDIPLMIKVGIQKGKDGYDDQNSVKSYSAAQLAGQQVQTTPAQTQAAPTQQAATPAAAPTPPWKR